MVDEVDNVIDFEQKSLEKHIQKGGGVLRSLKINSDGEMEEVGVKKIGTISNPDDLLKEIAAAIFSDMPIPRQPFQEEPVYDEVQHKKLVDLLTPCFTGIDFESHKFDYEKRWQHHVTLAWTKFAAFFIRRSPHEFDKFKNPSRPNMEKQAIISLVTYGMIQAVFCDLYRFYGSDVVTLDKLIDGYCKWFICKYDSIKKAYLDSDDKLNLMMCVEDTVKNIIDDHAIPPSELGYILVAADISIEEFIEQFGV